MLAGATLILFAFAFVLVDARVVGNAIGLGVEPPKNEVLRLTVPKMKRVKNVPVYTAAANDTQKLDAGAIHVRGTGFPWQRGANVYIAGHRLGYPRTGSFLLFYDLNKLKDGDKVVLRDARGRRYVYRVFNEMVVSPDRTSVTKPVAGKNIVSLQACTLPDYSRRLIVQAELVKTWAKPARASASNDSG